MSLNGDIRSWVCDAGKDESFCHLVFIEERLVGVVDGTGGDQTSARAAGTSSAGVWKINTGFLGSVEDVGVISAVNRLLTIWGHESDFVGSHHLDISSSTSTELGVKVVSHWDRGGTR